MARQKLYALTDEHRAQLKPWADRWIANALSTAPMTDEERHLVRQSVRGLYTAAGLTPPPDHRIVCVPSPFVARVAAGFAAAIWSARQQPTRAATRAATMDATRAATRAATMDATRAATRDATRDATRAATWAATEAATRDATWAATEAATRDATRDATGDATTAATEVVTRVATRAATEIATTAATRAATWDATRAATEAATRDATETWYVGMDDIVAMARAWFPPALATLAIADAYHADRFWDGGNQWSGYPAYLSFFRHIAQLPLDYSKWDHYEQCALHSGPRMMHAQFCLISDRPRVLTVDAQSRPHHASGPFCRWSDGTALYAWHGTRVPWWVIEQPERLTPERIQAEPNAEVRRAMIERLGWDVWLERSRAQPIQVDAYGALYRTELDGARIGVVVVDNSTPEPDGTIKKYALLVPDGYESAHAAIASTFGLTPTTYRPIVQS